MKKRACSVQKIGDVYSVRGKLVSGLKPRYLAKNPITGDLFLLLGGFGSYSLLRGNEEKGLRFCRVASAPLPFADCFALPFEQDGVQGIITDPDFLDRQKPVCDERGDRFELEVLNFRVEE